ncbi:hypothetical protein [Streptomyces tendae]|uniref:hypothetical protein n=1 Tax=Streptomyces tendae TaxID=1932 RepID=UPI0034401DC1
MNQINVAHPDAPMRDEAVPSRYALKVGNIDITVISDGVLAINRERYSLPSRWSSSCRNRHARP